MAATAAPSSVDTDNSRLLRLLGEKAWHSSAPGKLRRAASERDTTALWKTWKKYLEKRDRSPLRDLVVGKKSPLSWTLSAKTDKQTERLIELLDRTACGRRKAAEESAEQLSAWLVENEGTPLDRLSVLQCLGWCHSLPQLVESTSAELWCELLERLLGIAEDAVALSVEAEPAVVQMLRGELPLTLAYLLPELQGPRALGKQAAEFLSNSIVEMLDGEGVLHARYLETARDLLACWTRCRALSNEFKAGRLSQKAGEQYAWLITSMIRQCRHDGTQVLAEHQQGPWSAAMFDTALDLEGDEADEEIADVALPGRSGGYEPEEEWPATSNDSEWAEIATLRSDWARTANQVSIAYDRLPLRCELNAGKQAVFSSPWEFEIEADGRRLEVAPDEEWEQVCWESDNDCDYLEVEIDLEGGLKLQRSFLLAHEDQFLIMADTLLGTFAKQLDYCGRLRLAPDLQVRTDKKHSELAVGLDEPTFRILPLGISEWQSDRRRGTLQCNDGVLELRQSLSGSSMLAPLFLDLSRRRRKTPLTWRQLSVGEERQVVSSDVAVGYRVEIGKSQWVYYRSLAPRGNRTVLGQNLNSEIMVGRFHRDGSVTELLEVE